MVGGIKNNIVVLLDIGKIESFHTDIMEIYQVLQKNNFSLPNGNFHLKN
jgi:multidrug efflux pump subunit AcrB